MTGEARNAEAEGGAAVVAIVGASHFTSHVMQLTVPPLFPILHDAFGASFVALGMIVSVFYIASGLGQAVAGILVDRYGAIRILVAGLALISLSIGAMGLAPDYRLMLPLAVAAGLGNSVFHPADLSILSHRVGERLLGRAFAVHGLAASLGYAAAPVLVGTLATLFGWRVALVAIGAAGLGVAALVQARRTLLVYARVPAPRHAGSGSSHWRGYVALVGAPAVVLAFSYFVITAYAGVGIQTFSVSALSEGYGLDLRLATAALTAYLVAASCGTVVGGFLADRTQRHDRVAMSGLGAAAAIMGVVVLLPPAPAAVLLAMAVAGMANGVTGPSRDVIVRGAAGRGTGSVFGFVYSGGDLGSATAPLIFGAIGDRQAWHGVFLVSAVAFALAVPTVMQVRRRGGVRAVQAGD